MSNRASLLSVAEQLRLEVGAEKTASTLIGLAATMLLLSGTRERDLDRAMVDAFRTFDSDDTGARH